MAGELARAGALVSFNGKSFDAPLLETRYLFHRLAWPGASCRTWTSCIPRGGSGSRATAALRLARARRPAAESAARCRRSNGRSLGLRRTGDVPGFEIPARYFQFVRSGDAAPLAAVLEHNRLDLLSLAALTARLLHWRGSAPTRRRSARGAGAGPRLRAASRPACDGVDYEALARTSYRRALERCRSPRGAYDPIRIDALRALALACRRSRSHDEAASCWSELVAMRGCPPPIMHEAAEALAMHHEHRVRDLVGARRFALGSLAAVAGGARPSLAQAVRHRLARLERKLDAAAPGGLLD